MRASRTVALKAWLAVCAIFIALAVPLLAGMAVFVDPIRARPAREWIAVATLESLPTDGAPRRVPVRVARSNGWASLPEATVGDVFLRRTAKGGEIIALRTIYHGSPVEFETMTEALAATCWKYVRFDRDGRRFHSIAGWGNLDYVRTVVDDEWVFINVSDVSADKP